MSDGSENGDATMTIALSDSRAMEVSSLSISLRVSSCCDGVGDGAALVAELELSLRSLAGSRQHGLPNRKAQDILFR